MVSSTQHYRHDSQVYTACTHMMVRSTQFYTYMMVSSPQYYIEGKRGWSTLQYHMEFLLFNSENLFRAIL